MLMQQLIYYSRPFGFDQSMLANILESSRRRNASDGLSGALVCRNDVFLQLLEGPAGKVENCFNRIERDDRHVEVNVLVRATTDYRLFGEWAMYHDPQLPPMWTVEEVRQGKPLEASARQVRSIFLALAVAADL